MLNLYTEQLVQTIQPLSIADKITRARCSVNMINTNQKQVYDLFLLKENYHLFVWKLHKQ